MRYMQSICIVAVCCKAGTCVRICGFENVQNKVHVCALYLMVVCSYVRASAEFCLLPIFREGRNLSTKKYARRARRVIKGRLFVIGVVDVGEFADSRSSGNNLTVFVGKTKAI